MLVLIKISCLVIKYNKQNVYGIYNLQISCEVIICNLYMLFYSSMVYSAWLEQTNLRGIYDLNDIPLMEAICRSYMPFSD